MEEPLKNGIGDGALYQRQHYQVIKDRGYAHRHKCVDCQDSALDWSQIHDTDGSDINHYEPRCRSCHVKYDSPTGRGGRRTLTVKDVLQIRKDHKNGKWTNIDMAIIYGVSAQSIGDIVNRKTWKHI